METIYNKIYARTDSEGKVIHVFSQAFEKPIATDILIDSTNTERHGAQKYPVVDNDGYYNYCIVDGKLTERNKTADIKSNELNNLRARRNLECFPVVNRGQLWYENLTDEQVAELSVWYKEWLNAPDTGVVPAKPKWIT